VAIGLDTSVVVRLLVGLPESQAKAARKRLVEALEADEAVHVTDLVVAEAYFALQHHYEVPKVEARALLRRFLDSGVVRPEPPESAAVLAPAGGAGLVDRLVHARHRTLGATTLTFERAMGRLEGAERLRVGSR
jgi:predicted nucleic acid-binding protein